MTKFVADPAGVQAIADALRVSASLTKLNIDQEDNIGGEGTSAIAQVISETPSLALKELIVPSGVEKDERLKRACHTKGVKLV